MKNNWPEKWWEFFYLGVSKHFTDLRDFHAFFCLSQVLFVWEQSINLLLVSLCPFWTEYTIKKSLKRPPIIMSLSQQTNPLFISNLEKLVITVNFWVIFNNSVFCMEIFHLLITTSCVFYGLIDASVNCNSTWDTIYSNMQLFRTLSDKCFETTPCSLFSESEWSEFKVTHATTPNPLGFDSENKETTWPLL